MVEAGMGFWSSRAEGFVDIDLKCALKRDVDVSFHGVGRSDIDLNRVLSGQTCIEVEVCVKVYKNA